MSDGDWEALLSRVQQLERENAQLRDAMAQGNGPAGPQPPKGPPSPPSWAAAHGLPKAAVERYSRQMILPAFGAEGEGSC